MTCERTIAALAAGMRTGDHIGAQLYVSVAGEPVADVAVGESRPGVVMSTASLVPWLSAGKPLLAVAVAQLHQAGTLALDARVADYLPAFAQAGKSTATVRHLLTHTVPFASDVPHEMVVDAEPDDILDWICACALQPGTRPGTAASYSFYAAWYVLAEVVARATGIPIERYLADRVLVPLGMHRSRIGHSPEELEELGDQVAIMQNTAHRPPRPAELVSLARFRRRIVPGIGAIGPIRELGRFYEALLFDDESGPLGLRRDTVATFTSVARSRMYCDGYRTEVQWGLGFIVDRRFVGLPGSRGDVFGHDGRQATVGLAAPDGGVVVCLMFNGMAGPMASARRTRRALQAVSLDLRDAVGAAEEPARAFLAPRTEVSWTSSR